MTAVKSHADHQAGTPLLETVALSKSFGTFVANDAIDFRVLPGEIHALLGENGAGKSTLVKALFGLHQPDSGAILWRGEPVTIHSPAEARALGIGMVFQHFALFESLTVAENIALVSPPEQSLGEVKQRLVALSRDYKLELNPDVAVGDLSAGERQRVEIVRCLIQSPELIILDEPTSVLTPQEADDLFALLEALSGEGRAIIYISHKLDEVRRLCQAATILRLGKVVAACTPADVEKAELARLMVGEPVAPVTKAATSVDTTAALEVERLSLPSQGLFGVALKAVSFSVNQGEIAAIAGIAGNGQSELFAALSGERAAPSAEAIRFHGTPVGDLGITQRRKRNADFISEERLGHGTAPEFSLSENVMLTRAHTDAEMIRSGVLKFSYARQLARRIRDAFDVRSATPNPPARALSGGNLQKFIVGRAVDRMPDILIINQPTWGVDARAAAHIRSTLVELARQGTAVLIISQDLDEIYEVADRIAVICDGSLTPFQPAAEITPEQIGILMSEAAPDAA
jgi:ABC-type uncharacterized transport system ATPase subunit